MFQRDQKMSCRVPAMPLAGELSGRRRTSAKGLTLALLAVLALCIALPRPALAASRSHAVSGQSACANANANASSTSAQTLRAAVVCLVNQERARYHLPALHEVRKLTTSAQSYTSEMVRDDFFSHTAPNGSTPGARITATGFRWSWAGENIASGYPTPLSVVTGWMQSQGHCYNILAPVFSDIGVGVSPQAVAQATGPATWTQDFGLPLGAQAPSNNWGPANSCPHSA
jgi:uncharacterized protein YkwD